MSSLQPVVPCCSLPPFRSTPNLDLGLPTPPSPHRTFPSSPPALFPGHPVHPFIPCMLRGHMFNTSLRRVARTCSNASPAPSRPTTPTIASFTSHAHQRRHSSSKPPVPPNNGSSAIPPASVKQVGAPRSDTKRSGAESRLSKRKVSKDKLDAKQVPQDDWTSKLPSVPSLQHLNPKGMCDTSAP